MSVSLRNIPDTRAALGWAGGHTLVIDRPEGRAGGRPAMTFGVGAGITLLALIALLLLRVRIPRLGEAHSPE